MEALKIERKNKASKMISVRFTEDEYAQLDAKANKSGVPLATLVRAAALYLVDRNVEVN